MTVGYQTLSIPTAVSAGLTLVAGVVLPAVRPSVTRIRAKIGSIEDRLRELGRAP